jgi:hypothetical protein
MVFLFAWFVVKWDSLLLSRTNHNPNLVWYEITFVRGLPRSLTPQGHEGLFGIPNVGMIIHYLLETNVKKIAIMIADPDHRSVT